SGCGRSWPKCEGSFFFDHQNLAQMVEYIHRASSGLYGIFAIGLVIYTLKKKKFSHYGLLVLGFLFFVFVEAWVGRMLVVRELVVDDQRLERLFWMGLHFLNTLVLVSTVALVWFQTMLDPDLIVHPIRKLLKTMFTSKVVVGFLMISLLGIITAFYDTTVVEGGKAANNLPQAIQILRNVHPFAAVLYVLSIVYFYVSSKKVNLSKNTLLIVLIGNLCLGALNVLFHHIAALQVAHVFVTHMIYLTLMLGCLHATQKRTF
ncbi:MAG: COX15/CtaA family protein, partial [Bdellovibrionales bacterium]|nr:COX15/CtaA family protein [Bdellovibrionales bacterium]